ncbi:hypothetical protein VNI00_008286 [Paramarasmius palmivorus]|uniref:Uncharacterized protein n=1 Tax=Paramarasmius palmivorus TaxID=297713 RepID=A0AAW0CYB4_9AGAR
MTTIDDVRNAIAPLKSKAKSSKDEKLMSAVEQLSANLRLLETSSITSKSTEHLCKVFREPLIPLYKRFTSEALRFSSALFSFIYELSIGRDDGSTGRLNGVLNAILSGIMDFLDGAGSNKHAKAAVSKHFYSLLSKRYFPASPLEAYEHEPDVGLLCAVYMLLSDSAFENPENQRELRSKHLKGGKLIGVALVRCRAFLAVEALLELLGGLIPPANRDIKKHEQFSSSVFDPDLFQCHAVLKSIVANHEGEWEKTSAEIVDVLAKMNINFPQPFKIVQSAVSCDIASPTGRLYMDEKGLTSNVEEEQDGGYETFHVPYLAIERIRFSSYDHSPSCTTFTFNLVSPPSVGRNSGGGPQPVTLTIDIERTSLPPFLKVLKARGLAKVIEHGQRKLSKLDTELPLNSPPTDLLILKQEKVQQFCEFPSEGLLSVSTPTEANPPLSRLPTLTPIPESPVRALPQAAPEADSRPKSPTTETRAADPPSEIQTQSDVVKDNQKNASSPILRDDEGSPQAPKPKRKSEVEDTRPAKRPRDEPSSDVHDNSSIFGRTPKTVLKKRYGRKGRTSSPSPAESESEYEDIPAPKTRRAPPPRAAKGGKAAAMKGKANGQPATTATSKAPPKKEKAAANQDIKRPMEIDDDSGDQNLRSELMENSSPNKKARVGPKAKAIEDGHKPQRTPASKIPVANPKASGKAPPNKHQVQVVVLEEDDHVNVETPAPKKAENDRKARPSGSNNSLSLLKILTENDFKRKTTQDKWERMNEEQLQSPETKQRTEPEPQVEAKETLNRRSIRISEHEIDKAEDLIDYSQGIELMPWDKQNHGQTATIRVNESEVNHKPVKAKSKDRLPATTTVLKRQVPEPPLEMALDELDTAGGYQEYFVPVKQSDESKQASPDSDKIMIDLTQEDSPSPIKRKSARVKSTLTVSSPSVLKSPPKKAEIHQLIAHPPELNSPVADPEDHLDFPLTTKQRSSPSVELRPPRTVHLDIKPRNAPVTLNIHTNKPSVTEDFHSTKAEKTRSNYAPARASLGDAPQSTPRILDQEQLNLGLNSPLPGKPSRIPVRSPDKQHSYYQESDHLPKPQRISALLQTGNIKDQIISPTKKERGRHTVSTSKPAQVPRSYVEKRSARYVSRKYVPIALNDLEEDENRPRSIADVLGDISEVLVSKINMRIESVKAEVRIGRDNILREAAVEVEKMSEESAICMNTLVELESDYSSYRREALERLDDAHRINTSIVQRLEEIMEHHDRNSVSKKFPKVLPSLPKSLGLVDA